MGERFGTHDSPISTEALDSNLDVTECLSSDPAAVAQHLRKMAKEEAERLPKILTMCCGVSFTVPPPRGKASPVTRAEMRSRCMDAESLEITWR